MRMLQSAEITKTRSGYNARFSYNGNFYDVALENEKEVARVEKLLKKGKISIEEDPLRPKFAKIKNVMEPRFNKLGIIRYTIPTLIGLGIIIFSVMMLYQGYQHVQKEHGMWDITDTGVAFFFLTCIYGGISLIRYAFGKNVYIVLNVIGILVTGFGFCELFFVANDIGKDKTSSIIGSFLVFAFIMGAGILLIWMSHIRKNRSDISVRRTPVLPPRADIERIYDRMKSDNKTTTFMISVGDGDAEYTGSRVGGEPYSDGSKIDPELDLSEDQSLSFLFQINLRDLGEETELPGSGILQFYLFDSPSFEDIQIKIMFYPYINEMLIKDPGMSKPLILTRQELPDMGGIDVYDMSKVSVVAEQLGITLSPDLDWWELFEDVMPDTTHGCYLLGPAKLPPPRTEALLPEDRYINRPLLMLDTEDESTYDMLLMNEGDYADMNLQVYTSLYGLQHPDAVKPEEVKTVHAFLDDTGYGKLRGSL